MKQIKGIFLFLMSVVLVAFGSQDSKNSKGLVKKLEDGTKEVGKSIVGKKNKAVKAENKKEVAKKEENKKVEQKSAQPQPQPVQQPATAAAAQPQPQPQCLITQIQHKTRLLIQNMRLMQIIRLAAKKEAKNIKKVTSIAFIRNQNIAV